MYECKRLILRKWNVNDFLFLDAILGDPVVMKFSDNGILSKQDQRIWLQRHIESKQSDRIPGTLAIEHKQSEHVIGYVSLSHDPARVGAQDVEIGFRLSRPAWGQGFASEAATRALEAVHPMDRVVAIVDPSNERSVKLIKTLGLIYERDIMFAGYDYPDHLFVQAPKA